MSIKAFSCALKDNPDHLGIAVSESLVQVPDTASPSGVRIQSLIGVLWNDVRSPAPSYHEPSELQWLSVPGVTDGDEDEEDEEDDEEYETDEGYAAEAVSNTGALS
jgi:hypothetical protein